MRRVLPILLGLLVLAGLLVWWPGERGTDAGGPLPGNLPTRSEGNPRLIGGGGSAQPLAPASGEADPRDGLASMGVGPGHELGRATAAGLERPIAVELRWVGPGPAPALERGVHVYITATQDLIGEDVPRTPWGIPKRMGDRTQLGWTGSQNLVFTTFGTRYLDTARLDLPFVSQDHVWLYAQTIWFGLHGPVRLPRQATADEPPRLVVSCGPLTAICMATPTPESATWELAGSPSTFVFRLQEGDLPKPGSQLPPFNGKNVPYGSSRLPFDSAKGQVWILPDGGRYLVIAQAMERSSVGTRIRCSHPRIVELQRGEVVDLKDTLTWPDPDGVVAGRVEVTGQSAAGWMVALAPDPAGREVLVQPNFKTPLRVAFDGSGPVVIPPPEHQPKARVDANGQFRLEGLPRVSHTLHLKAPRDLPTLWHPRRPQPSSWRVKPDAEDLRLVVDAARIRVEFKGDVERGTYLPWVAVAAVGGDDALPEDVVWASETFHADRHREIVVSPGMPYFVTLRDHRFETTGERVVAPAAGESRTVVIEVTKKRTRSAIDVRLQGEGSERLRQVAFGLWPIDKDAREMTPTRMGMANRQDGRYRLPEIEAGTWRLHIRPGAIAFHGEPTGWEEIVQQVVVRAGVDLDLELPARRGPRLLVRARDGRGKPARARVEVRGPAGQSVHLGWRGSDDGQNTIVAQGELPGTPTAEALGRLVAGTWRLVFTLEGHRPVEKTIDLVVGKKHIVDVLLEAE